MIKKSFIAIVSVLLLVTSLLAEMYIEEVEANPVPYDSRGTSNVKVSIISPQNETYDSNNIELIANFGAFPGVLYIGYSLDGGQYIEIAPGHPLAHNLTETILLSHLPKGTHSIEVKATAMANDEDGKVIACSKVNFAVTKTLEPVSSSSTTLTPAPSIPEISSALTITFLIMTTIIIAMVVKRKNKRELKR